jgi:hypothetical protein
VYPAELVSYEKMQYHSNCFNCQEEVVSFSWWNNLSCCSCFDFIHHRAVTKKWATPTTVVVS